MNMDVQMSEAKTGTSCPSDPRRCRGVRERHDNVRRLGTGARGGVQRGLRAKALLVVRPAKRAIFFICRAKPALAF